MKSPESKNNNEEIAETRLYPLINTRLQERYDRIAPKWNSAAYEGTRIDDKIPRLIELGELPSGPTHILEAMCGTALLSQQILEARPDFDVWALDFSRGMLNEVSEPIHTVQASVVAMPFADKTFPRIFLRNALYDLPKRLQQQALQEIKRILADDGFLILQHYHTSEETFETLNELVKRKDIAANQNLDMGNEPYPRYFAPKSEFESWLRAVGLKIIETEEFEGQIRYLMTDEIIERDLWVGYAESIPEEIKSKIGLTKDSNGSIEFKFPGSIYKLSKGE